MDNFSTGHFLIEYTAATNQLEKVVDLIRDPDHMACCGHRNALVVQLPSH